MSNLMNGAFVQKYAPKNLADVVFSDPFAKAQIKQYADGLTLRPLLLHGPYGTGKSTIAELLPFAMVHNFQASDSKWLVGDVRKDFVSKITSIQNFTSNMSLNSAGLKVIVIDEFDNMDPSLQRSLKGHLDRFSNYLLFIFTTNNLKKVDGGIRSRCLRLHIGKAAPAVWLPRMRKILKAEKVTAPPKQNLLDMADASNGDCRELLSDLEDYVIRRRTQQSLPKSSKLSMQVVQGGKSGK